MRRRGFLVALLIWSSTSAFGRTAPLDDCQGNTLQGERWQKRECLDSPTRTSSLPTVSVAQLKIPEKARKAVQKARQALREKKSANAIRYLDRAIELYPRYADALALRSMLEGSTRPDEAMKDAQASVEYDPNYGPGYVALGAVYSVLGKFEDAVRTLNYAIILMPAFWQGYYEMTIALSGKHDFTAALFHLNRTYSLVPTRYPFLRLARAQVLMGLRDESAAILELEAYLREEPDSQKLGLEARKALEALREHRATPDFSASTSTFSGVPK